VFLELLFGGTWGDKAAFVAKLNEPVRTSFDAWVAGDITKISAQRSHNPFSSTRKRRNLTIASTCHYRTSALPLRVHG